MRAGKARTNTASSLARAHEPVPGDAGAFAYPSQPLNVRQGGGRYALLFGPVDANFLFPKHPSAVSFAFPSDFRVRITPVSSPRIVHVRSQRYLRVNVRLNDLPQIGGISTPCTGFVGWVY